MNRKEIRSYIAKYKNPKGLQRSKTKGAFGGSNRFLGEYKTLKVVPRSQRDTISCSIYGILDE